MNVRRLLFGLLLCLVAAFARADPASLATFGVDAGSPAPGHGWTFEYDADKKGWILIHVPPRGGTTVPAEEGTYRGPLRLAGSAAPTGLAAVDDTAYLLLEETTVDALQRRVMFIRAVVAGRGYVYEPAGRLAAAPRVEAPGTLEGFSGTSMGPAICTKEAERSLQVLSGGEWRRISLPKNLASALALQLLPDQSGRLAVFNQASKELHLARLHANSSGEIEKIDWTTRQLADFPSSATMIAVVGEEFLATNIVNGKLTLLRGGPSGTRTLSTIDDAPLTAPVVVLPASGHAVFIWSQVETKAGKTLQHTEMAEVSIHQGRSIYRGKSRSASPISADEVRTLVLLLILFMSSILVVLLRPVPEGKEATLPEGASLAEASRRGLAGLLDVLVALFITVKAFRISGTDLIEPELWFSMGGIELIIGVLLVGFLTCCMGEAMIGRSLGKLVTGCEVISILNTDPEGSDEPRLRQIVIRNAIKWLFPPITLSILLDPSLRHRGDLLAGTAVVVWAPKEDDDEDGLE